MEMVATVQSMFSEQNLFVVILFRAKRRLTARRWNPVLRPQEPTPNRRNTVRPYS